MTQQGVMTDADLQSIRDEIEQEMQDAVDFALNSPMPPIEELYTDVYVDYSNPVAGLR